MKVLLALPPETHELEVYKILGANAPPLGLAWIAAVLERAGHKVKIIDSPARKLGLKEFIQMVKSFSPDVIGFSIITPTAYRAYRAIKLLKEFFSDIPLVAGGPHPTFKYDECLNQGFDVVVCGEGELTATELINCIERYGFPNDKLREIQGIAFKDKEGRIIKTPPRRLIDDLSSLPWPAHHLLDMELYSIFSRRMRVAHVIASRGCPYGCIFCSTSYFWGRRVRFRPAKDVVDEIEYLVSKYGVNKIAFMDDELTSSRTFINEFIREVKERKLDIEFTCGSRVDHIDRELIKGMMDVGLKAIYFGVESASQETLNKIGKRFTLDHVVKAFKLVKELNLYNVGTFILGFPWESLDDMWRTVEFAVKLDPSLAQFTIATPYPGTPLYDYALRNNLIVDYNWEHYTTLRPVMRGFNFSAGDVGKLLAKAYRRFYLRCEFILRELKSGRLYEIKSVISKGILNLFDYYIRPRISCSN